MIVMITFLSSLRTFFSVAAGTASTLLILGGLAAAGAIVALTTVAIAGSVAGGLFVLAKVGDRRRERRSLY